jgi:hypothetical protein
MSFKQKTNALLELANANKKIVSLRKKVGLIERGDDDDGSVSSQDVTVKAGSSRFNTNNFKKRKVFSRISLLRGYTYERMGGAPRTKWY